VKEKFTMSALDLVRSALRSVGANKLRLALTMLGVVIGVASVIAMLALGNGARAAVDSTFKFLGADQIQIGQRNSMQNGSFQPMGQKLTYLDGLNMADDVPQVERVEMSASKTVKIRFGRSAVELGASGVTADALENMAAGKNLQPADWPNGKLFSGKDFVGEGQFFTTDEVLSAAPVCVLGYQTALDLFSGDEPVGETIWVERTRCLVIGVLTKLENTDVQAMYQADPNQALMMPISTMIKTLFDEDPSVFMVVHVNDANQIDTAKEAISAYLRQRHQVEKDANGVYQDDFDMSTLKDILGKQQEAARTFALLLAAMAAISLVVGGIGIMNVMLVSVTERTREIGIRLAVGARQKDIVAQFLLESVLISLSGGVVGIVLGILAIPLAALLNNGVALLLPGSIPLAFGVALLTGVLFGLYPALRAARLNPIEALGYE
jgi:putative ABC transport system permease protein